MECKNKLKPLALLHVVNFINILVKIQKSGQGNSLEFVTAFFMHQVSVKHTVNKTTD